MGLFKLNIYKRYARLTMYKKFKKSHKVKVNAQNYFYKVSKMDNTNLQVGQYEPWSIVNSQVRL